MPSSWLPLLLINLLVFAIYPPSLKSTVAEVLSNQDGGVKPLDVTQPEYA